MDNFEFIINAVLEGEEDDVVQGVHDALAAGVAPLDIINKGLVIGIEKVGELYQAGEYYLPELLIGARAMQHGMDILKPMIANYNDYSLATVVIGTVQGDMHDIGKNLVAIMMESAGFKIIDLGADVSPEAFIAAAKEHNADIVAMSALLSSTMMTMKTVIEQLTAIGLRDKVKVMVGGAPVSRVFADKIGADGFSEDAGAAIVKAKQLLGI